MAKAKVKRLVDYRRELKAAEGALMRARNALRAATIREGLDRAGILSETKFVERETAKRWARESSDRTFDNLLGVITRFRKEEEEGGQPSPFAFLSATAPATASTPPAKPVLVVDNDPPEAPQIIIPLPQRIS
jgi:hypothetical protein